MQKLPNGKSNSVFFPDGTWAPRPSDGYTFKDSKDVRYTWDDFSEKWYSNSYSGSVTGTVLKNDLHLLNKGETVVQNSVKVCECGSEKAGTFGHSRWCPKYE